MQALYRDAFALSGRALSPHSTQGVALGYVLVAPSGRALNACSPSGRALDACTYFPIGLEKPESGFIELPMERAHLFRLSAVLELPSAGLAGRIAHSFNDNSRLEACSPSRQRNSHLE